MVVLLSIIEQVVSAIHVVLTIVAWIMESIHLQLDVQHGVLHALPDIVIDVLHLVLHLVDWLVILSVLHQQVSEQLLAVVILGSHQRHTLRLHGRLQSDVVVGHRGLDHGLVLLLLHSQELHEIVVIRGLLMGGDIFLFFDVWDYESFDLIRNLINKILKRKRKKLCFFIYHCRHLKDCRF